MSDYISREDAVDELQVKVFHNLTDEYYGTMQVLTELPAADVVPVVHAHWIRHDDADVVEGYYVPEYECSKCRAWKKDDSDFCPDCGAKMDGNG